MIKFQILTFLISLNLTAVDFGKDVWPIFQSRCIKCHGPDKIEKGKIKHAKAGLRLDHIKAIVDGGHDGPVYKAGKSSQSSLYLLTDPEHDDVMPPKGDPLTKDQRNIIKKWIDEGAEFGKWTHHINPLPPESKKVIEKLAPRGATIVPSWQTTDYLMVNLRRMEKLNDEIVRELDPVFNRITELNVTGGAITDTGMKGISKMLLLESLNLSATKITDEGLAGLRNLEKLEYLNLFSTKVSDKSVAILASLPALKKLTLSNTKMTAAGVDKLKKIKPGLSVVFIKIDLQTATAKPLMKEEKPVAAKTTEGIPAVFPLKGKKGVLRFDFESGDLQGWKIIEGKAGHPVCSKANFRNRKSAMNKEGKFYLTTLETDDSGGWSDKQVAVIRSPSFILRGAEMSMILGGGKNSNLYIALCSEDGKEHLKAHGRNDEVFFLQKWSAPGLVGKKVYLKLVDRFEGGWGHILFDAFEAQGELVK